MHKVVTTQQLRMSDENIVAVNRRSRRWKQAVPVTLPFRVYIKSETPYSQLESNSVTDACILRRARLVECSQDVISSNISLRPTGTRVIDYVIDECLSLIHI